jgi:MFS family permease
MLLINTFLISIVNVFITGVFYTGFLSVNGIDIVRVGIITFIPFIAWGFSLFSPMILSKFKKRRALMLFNHIFYYICIVLATTIIPIFVTDNGLKTLWFAVFIFAGNILNALVGSGLTAWHMRFLPEGNDRNIYFSYTFLISTVIGTVTAILSSLFADSLAGSPQQGQIITMLRFVAFGLAILSGLLLFLVPKEFDYPKTFDRITPRDIIVIPFKARKFMLTALIVMLWNAFVNMNGSTWSYYVLNTMKAGYTYMYIGSIVCSICSIFLLPMWRRAIIRYSWFNMLFFTVLVAGLMEFFIGFSTTSTMWVFILVGIIQGFNAVGLNLVFANMFYINLKKKNIDIFTVFWNFAANISVLVGSMFGTWFLSLTEPHGPWTLFGLPFYGSQFLVWIKFVLITGLSIYIKLITPHIQPDEEEEEAPAEVDMADAAGKTGEVCIPDAAGTGVQK